MANGYTDVTQMSSGIVWGKDQAGEWQLLYDPNDPVGSIYKTNPVSAGTVTPTQYMVSMSYPQGQVATNVSQPTPTPTPIDETKLNSALAILAEGPTNLGYSGAASWLLANKTDPRAASALFQYGIIDQYGNVLGIPQVGGGGQEMLPLPAGYPQQFVGGDGATYLWNPYTGNYDKLPGPEQPGKPTTFPLPAGWPESITDPNTGTMSRWNPYTGTYEIITPGGGTTAMTQYQAQQLSLQQQAQNWLQQYQQQQLQQTAAETAAQQAWQQAQLAESQRQFDVGQQWQQQQQQYQAAQWLAQLQQDWAARAQELARTPTSWIEYWQMQHGTPPSMAGGIPQAGVPATALPPVPQYIQNIQGGGWNVPIKYPGLGSWTGMTPSQQQGWLGYASYLPGQYGKYMEDVLSQLRNLMPNWTTPRTQYLPSYQR